VRLLTVGICLLACEVLVVASAGGPVPRLRNFSSPAERFCIEQAVAGAVRRLESAECQQIFSDFSDESGRRLADNLRALQVSAAEYLTAWVWFVEASDQPQCSDTYNRVAFTTRGSRVIFICAARLVKRASNGRSPEGEIVIVHELLHSLGLGENPPTSKEITSKVMARCAE
jgi:hypothetical protein